VPVTIAFLLGILLGEYATPHPLGMGLAGLLSAVAALGGRRRAKSRVVAVLLLWLCLGVLRVAVWERHPDAGLTMLLSEEPQPVQLHGLVVDDPVELFEPGEAPAAAEEHGRRREDRQIGVLALRHRRTERGWRPIAGRVRMTIIQPREPLRYGDEILVEGQWSLVPAPGNPGQYDWRAALARRRIHGLVRVRPYDGLMVLRSGQGNPLLTAVYQLRRRWERLLRAHFSPRDAGLLLGLLLGQRAEIDDDLKDAFTETGTIHLLVISGFNVGLIALLLEWLLRLAGLPWRLRLCASAAGLGGYAVLTGLQPPVLRATLMAWTVLGAQALDRVLSWPNTLAAAALAILLVNPAQLFDPGFQLSFGAVGSLLAFTPRWSAWCQLRLAWLHPGWLRRYVALSLSATSAVWAGLAPALAWYFHLLSPVSMLANLLITPLMSVLVALGTTVVMAGTLLEAVVSWAGPLLYALLEATVRSVVWCQSLPGGHWIVGRPPPALLLGYYGLVALSLLRHRLVLSRGRLLACWAAAVALWISSGVVAGWRASRWLQVDVLDVGHGDSIVVRTPRGQTLLVDAGSEEAGAFRLLPFLQSQGLRALDALLLTHTDDDHIGGAIPLLDTLRIRRLLTNGVAGDTMSARRLRRLSGEQGIPTTALAAGMTLGDEPALRIAVLHPPRGLLPGVPARSNDNSVVLKLTMGSVSVLLTGDLEEAGIPWLLGAPAAARSAVLKVPHHGSRLGEAGERLFRAVRPAVAVLSVGRAHRLPAPETIAALRSTGAAIYSTREDGAIRLRTDGRRLEVRTFRSKQRDTIVPADSRWPNDGTRHDTDDRQTTDGH
jgi:competence protein ComEC